MRNDKKVKLKVLVKIGVAELYEMKSENYLHRGPAWKQFYDKHGYLDTKKGIGFAELKIELAKIFKANNVIPIR
jgi:hypothetical protein